MATMTVHADDCEMSRVDASFNCTCGAKPEPMEAGPVPPKRTKGLYVGAPACFALTQACQQLNDAFGGFGAYLVGSALERPDWRDIDVRFIMSDAEFEAEFPHTLHRNEDGSMHEDGGGTWEHDPKWLLLTVSISAWLRQQTGLPVDFQFQPQTHANKRHKGRRNALGLRFAKPEAA